MKKTILYGLAAGLILCSASAQTWTLYSTFDNSFNGGTPGDEVGTGTFSYECPSELANGSYLLSSFTGLAMDFSFINGSTFSLSDLVADPYSANVGVDINNGQFNFTTTRPDGLSGGAVAFQNTAGNYFSVSPNRPGQSYGFGYGYAAYGMGINGMGGASTYEGAYGIGSAPASVPEPSTYALFGLGALALIIAYRRKVA
jgi:hypothetical protein